LTTLHLFDHLAQSFDHLARSLRIREIRERRNVTFSVRRRVAHPRPLFAHFAFFAHFYSQHNPGDAGQEMGRNNLQMVGERPA
jgi:hypothetical protein